MKENRINLQSDGNIVIEDAQAGNITINTNNMADILPKLQQLNSTQLVVMKQIAEEQAVKLNDVFKTLLSGVSSQKNVVHGNISNVKTLKIGDQYHYNYHTEKDKLPKQLTAKIPRTEKWDQT